MQHYLLQGNYSSTAVKAMTQNPHDREVQASKLITSAQGRLIHFFFTLDENDWVVVCELPDDKAATAVSMAIGASGAMTSTKTVKLMTAEAAMDAMQMARSLTYAAPSFADLIASGGPA